MTDAEIFAEYLDRVAENIDSALMESTASVVKVGVSRSDMNSLQEAANLLRELDKKTRFFN